MIAEISARYGTLHTTGSYSISGHRALADSLPLLEGAIIRVHPKRNDYSFVDWEQVLLVESKGI